MLKPAILTLAAVLALSGTASAGDRTRDRTAVPPDAGARYYGQVNNYYAPVTIYAAPDDGGAYAPASAPVYPAYGGYAAAPDWDANSYGAGYDWSHGYGYDGTGGGTVYPAYRSGYGHGYPPANDGARLSPWNGYNGGFGNGYW